FKDAAPELLHQLEEFLDDAFERIASAAVKTSSVGQFLNMIKGLVCDKFQGPSLQLPIAADAPEVMSVEPVEGGDFVGTGDAQKFQCSPDFVGGTVKLMAKRRCVAAELHGEASV